MYSISQYNMMNLNRGSLTRKRDIFQHGHIFNHHKWCLRTWRHCLKLFTFFSLQSPLLMLFAMCRVLSFFHDGHGGSTWVYIYTHMCEHVSLGNIKNITIKNWANRTRGDGNTWTSMDVKVQMVQWPNRNGILANQRRTGINVLYRWIISNKAYICSSPGLSTPQHWGWIVFETTNRMISMPETIDFPLKHGVSCKICLRLIQWNMEPDLNTLDDKVIEPTACWALISKATLRRQGVQTFPWSFHLPVRKEWPIFRTNHLKQCNLRVR